MTRGSTGPIAELAAHYGCLVDPAGSRKPRDKAQVERPMPYIRDSFWRGREFTSLEQMQAEAVRWSAEVAGQRPCRPLDGAAPAAVFAAAEAGALAALPGPRSCSRPGRGARSAPTSTSRSARACTRCRGSTSARPSTPASTATMVQLFAGGDLVKTHVRKPRGKQTDLGDYPPEKIAFHMRTPAWCRRKAAEIGPACAALIAELLEDNALYRLRAAQGVLGLADKHQPGRLEAACAKAAAAGDPSYRTVKGILAAGTEASPAHRACRGRRRRRRSCTAPTRCSPPGPPPPATSSRCAPAPAAPRRRHDPPHRERARRRDPAHHGSPPPGCPSRDKDGRIMTTTIETSALDKALRTLKLSGMLAHHRGPPGPGPRRGTRPYRVPPGPVRGRDHPPRDHVHDPPAAQGPLRGAGHPGRLRLQRLTRSCPPPRSATWPPCAGCTPASR